MRCQWTERSKPDYKEQFKDRCYNIHNSDINNVLMIFHIRRDNVYSRSYFRYTDNDKV